MNRIQTAGVAAVLGLLVTASSSPRLTGLQPITLRDGVNIVPGFLPNGAAPTVAQAWRANGNAHGHYNWLVLGSAAEGHGAAEATLENPTTKQLDDVISDAPFDGERVLGTVRFARGTVAGLGAAAASGLRRPKQDRRILRFVT